MWAEWTEWIEVVPNTLWPLESGGIYRAEPIVLGHGKLRPQPQPFRWPRPAPLPWRKRLVVAAGLIALAFLVLIRGR